MMHSEKNKKNTKGFTMVEVLLTVAILGILFGIAFVAVNQYSRSLKFNEMNGTAKEIYIASQNQLSKAKADGRLAKTIKDKSIPESELQSFIYIKNGSPDKNSFAEDILLPFGSIDETVRESGSYVIKCDLKAGNVIEVFYIDGIQKYKFSEGEVGTLETKSKEKDSLKNYNGKIVGSYLGSSESLTVTSVTKPALLVDNSTVLKATCTVGDNVTAYLCVKGVASGARATIPVTASANEKILDAVDQGTAGHFINFIHSEAYISKDAEKRFIAGEDIELFVTVQAATSLSNVEESDHIITNSLFASASDMTVSKTDLTVQIGNYRHLENLDITLSKLGSTDKSTAADLTVKTAEQINDIELKDVANITGYDKESSALGTGFVPVNLSYSLTYFGKTFAVSSCTETTTARPGGLFGEVSDLTVQDLELRNFNISSSDDAGALVGKAAKVNVTNVIAYNCQPDPNNPNKTTTVGVSDSGWTIKSTGGNSGGLIGSMNSGTVNRCAASVYVNGDAGAGGLIGSITSGTVTNSYSGGHTSEGQFTNIRDGKTAGRVNVISENGNAGGFAGISGGGNPSFTNCYSSSSVYGKVNSVHPFCGSMEMKYLQEKEANTIYYICRNTDNSGEYVTDLNWYGIGAVYTNEAEKNTKYPWFRSEDLSNTNPVTHVTTKGLLNLSESSRKTGEEFNYDEHWSEDIYPSLTISEMNPNYKTSSEPVIWFMEHHVGDWAYPDYTANLINTQ